MQIFSFNPPISLSEERKWFSAVTSFEATNSVFNTTDEKISFSISTPGQLSQEDGEALINKLNEILELESENDIGLHVKEVEKRGIPIEIENSSYNLAGFDHFETEFLSELRRVKYRDCEYVVNRFQLLYDEIIDIPDIKYIAGSTKG